MMETTTLQHFFKNGKQSVPPAFFQRVLLSDRDDLGQQVVGELRVLLLFAMLKHSPQVGMGQN